MQDVIGNPTSYFTPLAPEDRDSAYQLFVQEAVELFQQVEVDLHRSKQKPSSPQLRPIIQAIQIIKSGAIQLNLTTFQYSVHRLEQICSMLRTNLLTTEIELLCQICQTLKLSLLAHIQQIPTAKDIDCAAAQVILVQLEKQLQDKPQQAPAPIISTTTKAARQSSAQLTALALSAELEEALLQVERQLASSPSETLAMELTTSFENLRDLGEMSNFSELVAISQTALTSLQTSPRTAAIVGKIALAGYREAQPPHPPGSEKEIETLGAEQPFSEPENEVPEIIFFDTADAFVWQTGGTIFVLPSKQILEILIPTPDQVDQTAEPAQLKWQEHKLPVYPLTQFINEPKASLLVTPSLSSYKKSSPLLIVQQHDQTLALKIEIERLITVSALELQSSGNLDVPEYERGSTFLENSQLYSVVDVEMLLNQAIVSIE